MGAWVNTVTISTSALLYRRQRSNRLHEPSLEELRGRVVDTVTEYTSCSIPRTRNILPDKSYTIIKIFSE